MMQAPLAAGALLALGLAAGCTTVGVARPRSLLDARALSQRPAGTAGTQTATGVYRNWLAWTWGSHCRMLPTDSEYFDRVVARCGAVPGMVAGVARLLLEVEATSEVLTPVATPGQTVWLAPPRPATCWR